MASSVDQAEYFADNLQLQQSRRGRPRNNAMETMSEFDLNLINEFKSRPELYDRNSPLFKDKLHTAREWQSISNKLGYDVSLLKDRMLQLRNRYNMEKRRIEQLREEKPGLMHIDIQWPLYPHLQFLSEHIRARRSYKRTLAGSAIPANVSAPERHLTNEFYSGASNASSAGGVNHNNAGQFLNGFMQGDENHHLNEDGGDYVANGNMTDDDMGSAQAVVKVEMDQQDQNNQLLDNDAANNPEVLNGTHQQNGVASSHQYQQHLSHPQMVRLRNIENLRENPRAMASPLRTSTPGRAENSNLAHSSSRMIDSFSQQQMQNYQRLQQRQYHEFQQQNISMPNRSMRSVSGAREAKYFAFGDFVGSSLSELPQHRALQIIEKFTSELVAAQMSACSATHHTSKAYQNGIGHNSSVMNGSPSHLLLNGRRLGNQ